MNINLRCFGVCLIMLVGCAKENDNTVGFSTTSKTVDENAGVQEITVQLGKPVKESTLVYFDFDGKALLNGDFKLLTPSPLTIAANSTSTVLRIEIIDESIIESSEDLTFQLNAASGNLVIPEAKSKFAFTINDNDTAPSQGVQVDLTWTNATGKDIDAFDLNLYIANNVTIQNDTIQDFDIYSKSENQSGFETSLIGADAPDGDYYLVPFYNSGSNDVPFTLEVNGSGFSHATADGTFKKADVGSAFFYGPITKAGTSFSRIISSGGITSKYYRQKAK